MKIIMKKLIRPVAFSFIIFLLGALASCCPNNNPPVSTFVILQPGPAQGKDAFVETYPPYGYDTLNFGDSIEFAAISWTGSGVPFVERSFIDFNFDTIPANATVDSAFISLYAYADAGHGMGHDTIDGTNECYLQRVTGKWDEHSITWNNQPPTTDIDQVTIPESDSAMQNYLHINVTNLVIDTREHLSDSYGFMLRLRFEQGYRRMMFSSSDIADPAKRPKLVIYYTKSGN
jgi:hypothetical protein